MTLRENLMLDIPGPVLIALRNALMREALTDNRFAPEPTAHSVFPHRLAD